MTKKCLEGVKVANFGWYGVVPFAVRPLALFGATVVHVESHVYVDAIRNQGPFKGETLTADSSTWFAQYNTSTYGIGLNLNKPKGREIGLKLCIWADIVAENFGLGTMGKWGLDYESIARVRPDIIYLSSNQLGQTGPYANWGGHGFLADALMGHSNITGEAGHTPTPVPSYTDFIAGRYAAIALLAALNHRGRTGQGQYIDQAQVESSTHLIAPILMDNFISGREMHRHGNRVDFAAPHGVYPCQGDGRWCAIGVFTDSEWEAFCKVIGEPDKVRDPKYSTLMGRKENEAELDALVSQWSINHPAEEVEALMQSAGIAASVVENAKDLHEDPQLRHRGFFRELKHSVMGPHFYRGPCFRLSKTPDSQFAASGLGEHNEYVCKEILGLSQEYIAEAFIEGALGTAADVVMKI